MSHNGIDRHPPPTRVGRTFLFSLFCENFVNICLDLSKKGAKIRHFFFLKYPKCASFLRTIFLLNPTPDTIYKSENQLFTPPPPPPPTTAPGTLKISLQFLYYFIHIHRHAIAGREKGVQAENISSKTLALRTLALKTLALKHLL